MATVGQIQGKNVGPGYILGEWHMVGMSLPKNLKVNTMKINVDQNDKTTQHRLLDQYGSFGFWTFLP